MVTTRFQLRAAGTAAIRSGYRKKSVPNLFPPAIRVAELQKLLQQQPASGERAFVGFHVAPDACYGYWISEKDISVWKVERPQVAKESAYMLREAIGIGQSPSKVFNLGTKTSLESPCDSPSTFAIPRCDPSKTRVDQALDHGS